MEVDGVARPSGPKTRNDGIWTEAKFIADIKNLLRSHSRKWRPVATCKKKARVSRGMYKCAECLKIVPATHMFNGKRRAYFFVDHIEPVIDPEVGFTGFSDFIERLFCEVDNLQVLCKPCHDEKCAEETQVAVKRRAKEKKSGI